MRMPHFLAIALVVLMMIIAPLFYASNMASISGQKNSDYTNYVFAATKAAMEVAYESADGDYLFGTDQKASETYYNTLMRCFGYETRNGSELVRTYTPCLFFVDKNGFYVEYGETYRGTDGFTYTSDVMSNINKWTRNYDSYTVEFHLDDSVVVKYDGKVYSGTKDMVLKKLGTPAGARITTLLSDNNEFQSEKNDVIINKMQNKLEYYINLHDTFYNQKNDFQYSFTLPKITGEDWGRLLDQPTIIGFLQGVQLPYNGKYLNVYGFTGHEVAEQKLYCIKKGSDGNFYFHDSSCSEVDGYKRYTMAEAAKEGAFPALPDPSNPDIPYACGGCVR